MSQYLTVKILFYDVKSGTETENVNQKEKGIEWERDKEWYERDWILQVVSFYSLESTNKCVFVCLCWAIWNQNVAETFTCASWEKHFPTTTDLKHSQPNDSKKKPRFFHFIYFTSPFVCCDKSWSAYKPEPRQTLLQRAVKYDFHWIKKESHSTWRTKSNFRQSGSEIQWHTETETASERASELYVHIYRM